MALPVALLFALLILAAPARAQHLRSPQVYFASAGLQNDLNALGESIDVTMDQLVMGSAVAGNMACPFVLGVVARDSTELTVGVYSTTEATPTLCPLPSSGFRKGWYNYCQVIRDTMLVATFDDHDVFQGLVRYPGFDGIHTGLYVQSGGNAWYSEDARNQGRPQMLSFGGTGAYIGGFFVGIEGAAYGPQSTFTSVVVNIRPSCGDPVRTATWGQMKRLYR